MSYGKETAEHIEIGSLVLLQTIRYLVVNNMRQGRQLGFGDGAGTAGGHLFLRFRINLLDVKAGIHISHV